MKDRGVVFEAKGPNGWAIVGAGGLIGVALCIMALALWNLSLYAGIALIVLASGQAVGAVCVGAARIIEARGRAKIGYSPFGNIGPNTGADVEALWGADDGDL